MAVAGSPFASLKPVLSATLARQYGMHSKRFYWTMARETPWHGVYRTRSLRHHPAVGELPVALAAGLVVSLRMFRCGQARRNIGLLSEVQKLAITPIEPLPIGGGARLGYGENGSLTFLESGNKNLDLFFDAIPGICGARLVSLLEQAWKENACTALKLIFQLGDPRAGKGDLVNFNRAMVWLYDNHFDTLMLNLEHVTFFSCHRALLDLLQFSCIPGLLEDKLMKAKKHRQRKHEIRLGHVKQQRRIARQATHQQLLTDFFATQPEERRVTMLVKKPTTYKNAPTTSSNGKVLERWVWTSSVHQQDFEQFVFEHRVQPLMEEARRLRHDKRDAARAHARAKAEKDARYRSLYEAVAQHFAFGLREELSTLENGDVLGGLVGKWAPTPGGEHDKRTCIVDGIVEHLYPQAEYRLPEGTHENYISFMRDRYRKLLSKLRGAAQVPEHFVGSGQWHLVNYGRMASRCRQVHGHIFAKHDRKRYQEYLESAKTGQVKQLAAGAVLPHELTSKAQSVLSCPESDAASMEASLQWLRLISDTKAKGKLPPAMAVCDVSGSMYGTPMQAAIALSLLISDVSAKPWNNRICTFSENPSFVTVPSATSDNLGDRARLVQGSDWGFNTDLVKVFQELLATARFHGVTNDGMAKIVFIFSDMEFDEACKGCWQTDLEFIREQYSTAGYDIPQIVFWNLRPSCSRPASKHEPGVAFLSGFSAGMMKSFLEFSLDDFTPLGQMLAALAPYERLRVASSDVD